MLESVSMESKIQKKTYVEALKIGMFRPPSNSGDYSDVEH